MFHWLYIVYLYRDFNVLYIVCKTSIHSLLMDNISKLADIAG